MNSIEQLSLEEAPGKTNLNPVVSAPWLFEHLNDTQVVIIDCRFTLAHPHLGRQQYQVSHIPGAFFLDLNQDLSGPVQRHGGRHPLPNAHQLAAKLETIGVRSGNDPESTWVIAYDDSRFPFAARLWWLLRFLGHDRVAVLDGGFTGWQAAGYPVTSNYSTAKPGKFVPRLRDDWVVNIDQVKVKKEQSDIALVDSREPDRYRGEREPIDPVAGHIPGAVNYPWLNVTNPQGFLLPVQVQTHRWSALSEAKEIIVYCGSGVTACVNLLSLEISGYQNGKLYPGSWSDWCSHL